jgi:hypothetical protein
MMMYVKYLFMILLFFISNLSYSAIPLQRNTLYTCSVQANSNLYILNTSGAATRVGSIGDQCTDLAFVGSQLWGITFTRILIIDPTTGRIISFGQHGFNDLNALVAVPSSGTTFYSAGFSSGRFVRIRITNTGQIQTTALGSYGNGLTSAGDLVFLNGILYATVNRPGFASTWLARINPANGRATLIGNTGIGFPGVFGLELRSGVMYGATNNGIFLSINPGTGRGVRLGTNGIVQGGLAKSP